MKTDILEQMYRYYVQMPRYKELRKIYEYDIPKARRDVLKNSMGAENYTKAQEIALSISDQAERVGFILGFQIGSKLMCESIGEWEVDE